MTETRLADVPAPRSLLVWIISVVVAKELSSLLIQRTFWKAVNEDVIPATELLAEDISDRRRAADKYAADMKAMNATMVRLTWVSVGVGVVAALASIVALVIALI